MAGSTDMTKPTPEFVNATIRLPRELRDSIPPEYSLSKFILTAIREKLDRSSDDQPLEWARLQARILGLPQPTTKEICEVYVRKLQSENINGV
jgi:hypothetical protein